MNMDVASFNTPGKNDSFNMYLQKISQIGSTLSLFSLVKNFLIGLILICIFGSYIGVSVIGLVVFSVCLFSIHFLINYIRYKKSTSPDKSNETEATRQLLRTNVLLDALVSVIYLVTTFMVSVYVFQNDSFERIISSIEVGRFPKELITPNNIVLLIIALALINLIRNIIRVIFYYSVGFESDYATLITKFHIADDKLGILNTLYFGIVFLVLSTILGIPPVIILGVGGFLLFFVLVQFFYYKNVSTAVAQLKEASKMPEQSVLSPITYDNEQILGYAIGVMKTAVGVTDFLKPVSSEVMGVGKNIFPENMLVLTNYRILMVQVPMTGGDMSVHGVDYAMSTTFLNRGELVVKGKELLSKGIPDILKCTIRQVTNNVISSISINNAILKISTPNEVLGYTILDQEFYIPFNESLEKVFSTRVVRTP